MIIDQLKKNRRWALLNHEPDQLRWNRNAIAAAEERACSLGTDRVNPDDTVVIPALQNYMKKLVKATEMLALDPRGAQLTQEYQEEIDYLETFMPVNFLELDPQKLVDEAIQTLRATPQMVGQVIGYIMKKTPGLDGKTISQLVKQTLGK